MLTKQPEISKLKTRVFSSLSDDNYIVYVTTEQYFKMVEMKEINNIKRIEIL